MATMTVYHYTDAKGKEGILRSGRIQPSTSGHFGAGVYFTSMPPTAGRKAVSLNNFTSSSHEKVMYAFKLQLPTYKLTKHPGNRDILTARDPVNIHEHNVTILRTTVD